MIITGFSSHKGRQRSTNEDAWATYQKELFLVADGLGGYRGGQLASQLTVQTSLNHYPRLKAKNLPPKQILKKLIDQAHQQVSSLGQQQGRPMMSTTLVACLIQKNRFTIASVGDSRAYLVYPQTINQITLDQETDLTGLILQAIGLDKEVKADFYQGQLSKNQLLLLCSDGLTDSLTDREILKTIDHSAEKPQTLQTNAQKLIKKANQKGGRDNITVGLIKNV